MIQLYWCECVFLLILYDELHRYVSANQMVWNSLGFAIRVVCSLLSSAIFQIDEDFNSKISRRNSEKIVDWYNRVVFHPIIYAISVELLEVNELDRTRKQTIEIRGEFSARNSIVSSG